MKKLIYIAMFLFAVSLAFDRGNSSKVGKVCILSFCFGTDFELKSRELSESNGRFVITGYDGDEFTEHHFIVQEATTYEGLSFGMEDPMIHGSITAKQRIHILNDAAYKTYVEQYLRVKKQCPAGFVHQNLESVLLIPANDAVERELVRYDLPFSPDGTPFKLDGHFMTSDYSFFIKDDQRIDLTLATHEAALSNVGSANHKIHYFLVTHIYQ